jgi:hypothetical protein
MFEPIAESKKRKANKKIAKKNQKYLMIALSNLSLSKAKNPNNAVVRISPVNCQGKSL